MPKPASSAADRLISYYRGAKFPWWATLLFPFLIALLFLAIRMALERLSR